MKDAVAKRAVPTDADGALSGPNSQKHRVIGVRKE